VRRILLLDACPEEPQFAFTLAYWQRQRGELTGAEATLRESLRRHPASGESHLILVDLCVKAGKAQEARQHFAWTLEMKDLPDAYRTCIAVRQNSLPLSETKY
jgi:hypothetical protein